MATARFMETWAHGHDVADALGDRAAQYRPVQARRATSACAPAASPSSAASEAPGDEIRVELTGAERRAVDLGPEDAEHRVTRLGLRLRLLATRRRHRRRRRRGRRRAPTPTQWLTIVQAFAGLPGNDRTRRSSGAHDRPDRQLLRLLRRPPVGDARDARGRRARLPDRRLPRRADDAHPRPRRDEGPVDRLRQDVRPADRRLPGLAKEKGVKIVANAGGLNPRRARGEAPRGRRRARARRRRRPRRG